MSQLLDKFYYLAPVWFLLETFLWPNFRAGLVTGQMPWGNALFYCVEGGLGAALFFKAPFARTGVLLENVAYLVFAMKFILFAPIDVALQIDESTRLADIQARNYVASLPGIIYSMFQVGLRISLGLLKGGTLK